MWKRSDKTSNQFLKSIKRATLHNLKKSLGTRKCSPSKRNVPMADDPTIDVGKQDDSDDDYLPSKEPKQKASPRKRRDDDIYSKKDDKDDDESNSQYNLLLEFQAMDFDSHISSDKCKETKKANVILRKPYFHYSYFIMWNTHIVSLICFVDSLRDNGIDHSTYQG